MLLKLSVAKIVNIMFITLALIRTYDISVTTMIIVVMVNERRTIGRLIRTQ